MCARNGFHTVIHTHLHTNISANDYPINMTKDLYILLLYTHARALHIIPTARASTSSGRRIVCAREPAPIPYRGSGPRVVVTSFWVQCTKKKLSL